MKKPYKILVTGPPVSGKTQVAGKLEKDLAKAGFSVVNRDVDYDSDWRVIPANIDFYMLQTPHGSDAEKEDGINFFNFNKILYTNPDDETYKKFLAGRGEAWFKMGRVDLTEDFEPKPYSLEKLPKIIEKIAGYAINKHELVKKDIDFFSESISAPNLEIIVPTISRKQIFYKNYKEALDEILSGGKV